ncbi:MAG: DNA repair exonuclease [Oscillospiraceae bacterium]|nr:DNA repair exonuclease [Oscillospiraceae bacterium]
MKLIHCSDIHLDSPMESNLTAPQAKERNSELCRTFARMVEYAKTNGVSAVLLCGDLFDTERVSATTEQFILDTVAAAPHIAFLYLKGNHDDTSPAFSGYVLPENLLTFGEDWSYHPFGDVTVAGIELTDSNCHSLYDSLHLDKDAKNIVMLHGQTAAHPGEELVSLPDLRGKHIDYLALGHIHSYQTDKLDDRGTWCYCGCLEGRGYDECGQKGFVVLETTAHDINHRFVPFASRTLHDLTADITGLTTAPEFLSTLRAAAEGIPESDLVKFTLTGSYTPDTHKDLPFLYTMLQDRFYAMKIKDSSRLQLDAASYENDISLKGEFIRMVLAADLPQDHKDRIICAGLEALRGEEISL